MESTLRLLPRRGPHVRKAGVRVVRRLPGATARRTDDRSRCPQSAPQRLRRRL